MNITIEKLKEIEKVLKENQKQSIRRPINENKKNIKKNYIKN